MAKPTWGDTVRIRPEAPADLRPGSLAAVCGFADVETTEQAERLGCAVGTSVYLVEFGDGVAVEVPGNLLEAVEGG